MSIPEEKIELQKKPSSVYDLSSNILFINNFW